MAPRRKLEDAKAELLRCARQLFSAHGFKDTSVSDITELAGVAVGTFYNYFPSKESIFLHIFMQENEELKKSILSTVDVDGEPAVVIRELMLRNLQGMQSNPILKEWYNRDVFSKIERVYREENGSTGLEFLFGTFSDLIKQWQAQGKLRQDLDADMIMAFFVALINIDMHKEEIGVEYFPHIMDHLAEFILAGISKEKEA
jgi:AcrR family transcriptional regulator